MNSMSSSGDYSTDFNSWRDEADAVDLVEFVKGRGHKLVKQGHEWVGPCPACGGEDRFSINPRERVFNCRGFGGGGYIDAVMHIDDCDFMAACEAMTGRQSPNRPKSRKGATPSAAKPEARQSSAKPAEPAPEPETSSPAPSENGGRAKKRNPAELFNSCKPILGTHAADYFNARGLPAFADWTIDMRFHPALTYLGYPNAEADEQVVLGEFPALLCAIRNVSGDIIGVHRTYLDPQRPVKLPTPNGDRRNGSKKIVGKVTGGLIRLSKPSAMLVIGEGVETTRAAALLGIGGGDAGYAAAVSLGNLSGGCTGSIPHPVIAKRSIQNGIPDDEKTGAILPNEVEEVIVLGDGDSDAATTLAHLLTAGRRWKAQGRTIFYALAPTGKDWNDVLLEGAEANQ